MSLMLRHVSDTVDFHPACSQNQQLTVFSPAQSPFISLLSQVCSVLVTALCAQEDTYLFQFNQNTLDLQEES